MIKTAETHFGQHKVRLAHDVEAGERALVYHLPSTGMPPHLWAAFIRHGENHPKPSGKPKKSDFKLEARVNHGRWVVQCPCDEAQLACETDPFFFCASCENKMTGGRLVAVVWPSELERTRIERFLAHRYEKNQNWQPGVSIEQLDEDNKKNGVTL